MVLYFSATGNSEYTAKRIAGELEDEAVSLFTRLREGDCSPLSSQRPYVVVCPTYAWRIPRILEDWLSNTPLTGNVKVYFVMTCGGNIGNAGAYLEKLCGEKGLEYMGCAPVVMPENYLALFAVPDREEALDIVDQAEAVIDLLARLIERGERFNQDTASLVDRLSSGAVNRLFYPMFVHARKFRATGDCISCGMCERVCPLGNIHLEDGRPLWGKNCTHCMACIARCPKKAIEYGNGTKRKPRYICPKEIK